MNDVALRLYHYLPGSSRSLVASLHGYYLRSWRYGRMTERLMAEAVEREQWSPQQWKKWQEERLAYVLNRAATRVPYYREQWATRRRSNNRVSWEYLENWPILHKESVRLNAKAFVADDCDTRRMYHEHTSGTTGKSLDLWWSSSTVRAWYALMEARCRSWHGVSRQDRWAILGGQLVTPVGQSRPPFWVWNAAMKQLYMSSYHLAPDLIPYYLNTLKRYRVKYIFGYTSSLYALAQEALRSQHTVVKLMVAITNAEPVYDYQRRVISDAFGCPVRETYGMAEIVATASECNEGSLHLWPEVGVVEVLNGIQPVASGAAGDLVCTGLFNADMPLIRYYVGDRGTLSNISLHCTCGRTLPILKAVEGRADEVLYTPDGRCIGRLDPVFKSHLSVCEAQIVQEALNRVRVRYVPAPNFTPAAALSIAKRVRERLGSVDVVLEQLDQIPRERNGKFRQVICKLSKEERDYLQNIGGHAQ